jgi:hypothetical protein
MSPPTSLYRKFTVPTLLQRLSDASYASPKLPTSGEQPSSVVEVMPSVLRSRDSTAPSERFLISVLLPYLESLSSPLHHFHGFILLSVLPCWICVIWCQCYVRHFVIRYGRNVQISDRGGEHKVEKQFRESQGLHYSSARGEKHEVL